MKLKHWPYLLICLPLLVLIGIFTFKKIQWPTDQSEGKKIDSLNHVFVFYNGSVGNISGRNTTADGYNLGLKYQCVEFVKRYYYQHLNHRMPNSYGNAKDFFDKTLMDGQINGKRNLTQYTNPSQSKPQADDLLVYDGTTFNKYGHVAIVSKVTDNSIEIVQQNAGPISKSRAAFGLEYQAGKWQIKNSQILGWLRKD